MPLFKFKEEKNYQLAIWEIVESETFFNKTINLISHLKLPHRRLEFLASRYLLRLLKPDFPLADIQINNHGKPHLHPLNLHFSISHSFPYVAVIISQNPVGIDVQVFQEKIIRLQHKFLSPKEQTLFNHNLRQITLAWTAKEAAFKWTEHNSIDFIKHLPILDFKLTKDHAQIALEVQIVKPSSHLSLFGKIENNFAWMATTTPTQPLKNYLLNKKDR